MALHKFASNVVEKCLTHCSAPERDVLIREMLGEGDASSDSPEVQRSGIPAVGVRSDGGAGTDVEGAADASFDAAAAAAPGTAAAAAAARGGGEGGGLEGEEVLGLRDGEAGPEDPLQAMMKDQFGNYVVQKVLEVGGSYQAGSETHSQQLPGVPEMLRSATLTLLKAIQIAFLSCACRCAARPNASCTWPLTYMIIIFSLCIDTSTTTCRPHTLIPLYRKAQPWKLALINPNQP